MYKEDIKILQSTLPQLPKLWDGKSCVLELKDADYNWRQMEWCGWYFEFKVRQILADKFQFPGDKFENVNFDLKGVINWDIKAKASTSDEGMVILNDKTAMENSIATHGFHGEIIGLFDVEYNDVDRTFQRWHTDLKGGKSKYELQREQRTSTSRRRKTSAELWKIALVVLEEQDLQKLGTMNQGINSNGQPRPPKYTLDLDDIDMLNKYIIEF